MATITNGTFQFPANFDVQFAGPIDRRLTVDTYADLASLPLQYSGMLASVVSDTTASNNGPYFRDNSGTWTRLKVTSDPIATQIIDDDTSVSVSDDDTAIGSAITFNANGTQVMKAYSTGLEISGDTITLDAANTASTFTIDGGNTTISTSFEVGSSGMYAGSAGTIDLGALGKEFRDLYITGDANIGGDIILPAGSNITVDGIPFGVPTLTLSADSNTAGDWDTYDTVTKVGTLNSTTLGSKDGGTIIVNNEETGSNPIAYLPFEIDTANILDDTQKFLIAAKGYKQAAIILAEASTSIVYGTTTTAGDTVYVGNGQVLELWRQGGTNYYVIRSA